MIATTSLVLAALSAAPAHPDLDNHVEMISGTVTYLERIALPPNAELVVALDRFGEGEHINITEVTIQVGDKQVPIPFVVPYLPNWISEGSTYGIRAEIRIDGQVRFESDAHAMVIANGVDEVEITLVQAMSRPAWQIEDVRWELIEFDQFQAAEGPRPNFILDSTRASMGGHTGVNIFGGEYTLSNGHLQIDPGMQTMMAGTPEQMEMERHFLLTLQLANRVTIESGDLYLWRGDRLLASFRAIEDDEDPQ